MRTLRNLIDAGEGKPESGAIERNRKAIYGLTGALGLGSVGALIAAPPLGLLMLPATGALAVLYRRGEQLAVAERAHTIQETVEQQAESFLIDKETGLPNRQHLLDQLGRDIARSERYSYDMTVALIEIARVHDLVSAWGPGAADRAVHHVAETLRRITRTSDFVARIDDERFAVILMQCTSEQAGIFGDRVSLAVSNRPLKRDELLKVPVYVNVEVSALQYDKSLYRGPLEFLSAAGGEAVKRVAEKKSNSSGTAAARITDARGIRRQLMRDYYPEGKMQDFADAYRDFQKKGTRAG